MTQWREIEYQQTEKAQEIEISFGECEIEENKWSSVEVKNAKHIQICTQAQPRTMLCHCQCSAGRNWNETGFDCCFCCCFFFRSMSLTALSPKSRKECEWFQESLSPANDVYTYTSVIEDSVCALSVFSSLKKTRINCECILTSGFMCWIRVWAGFFSTR